MHLFLYGPPGSGKSTIGRILAERLDLPFIDLDTLIEASARQLIRDIFAAEGEAGFRLRESAALKDVSAGAPCVVGLGGGALLKPENRALAEATGEILCFEADAQTLERRCARTPGVRPLLSTPATDCAQPPQPGKGKPISQLLDERKAHYGSFPHRVTVSDRPTEETADAVQASLGRYRVSGMGQAYDVHVGPGLLDRVGELAASLSLGNRTVIVGDTHTLPLYGEKVAASLRASGITVSCIAIPAGEQTKTIETICSLWSAFLNAGIERGHTVIALGGGVVGDLTGFAAATWLRGIRWISLPTTLLAMVDSGLGGKTGADLPEGKNLIGAFHPPALVLADTQTLSTLPVREFRCGLAEALKHAVIADPTLLAFLPHFTFCKDAAATASCACLSETEGLSQFVARAMAVKIRIIQQDPYEKGIRASLNLGHTIGHGIEKATHFAVQHGEAVAIGTVLEARLAEALGLARNRLSDQLADLFKGLGLPVTTPAGINVAEVRAAITLDKKKSGGKVRFALPADIGDVRVGVAVDDDLLMQVLSANP
jgi:3-dehydroquinate synthase